MSVPYCLALVICDSVHQDPGTGKWTILGTFSNVWADSFPVCVQFCVYMALTESDSDLHIALKLSHQNDAPGSTDRILYEMTFPIEHPLAVLEGACCFDVEFGQAGTYHLELWSRDEHLMSRRLMISGKDELRQEVEEEK